MMTPEQEAYLIKIANIGLAEEADIIARTAIINAAVESENIAAGVISAPVVEEII